MTAPLARPPATPPAVPPAATAWQVAASVTDPELPMLTLADLGVLRDVTVGDDGEVRVLLTPTYSGCPALAAMGEEVVRRLRSAGFTEVSVGVSLSPAWTSDWITERGRQALHDHGISPPGERPGATGGSAGPGVVPLTLTEVRRAVRCPACDSADVGLTSEFGATACRAIYRCSACLEHFDHVKEH